MHHLTDCGGYFTQKDGYLTSPSLYGSKLGTPYPNNAACIYEIEQPLGYRINVTFTSFDVHSSSSPCEDFVEVR